MRRMLAVVAVVLALGALRPGAAAAQGNAQGGGTLDRVRSRGQVTCGVLGTIFGFSAADSSGALRGLDVDSCRAIAAAVLGDANKARFVVLPTQSRFTALQSGAVDVLFANTTWTYGRDTGLGISFTGVNYFDGQGFLIGKASGIAHAEQLGGATICLLAGGTAEQNMGDWFRAHKLAFTPVILDQQQEMVDSFARGRCDAMTQDSSALAAHRLRLGADKYQILPELVGTEPLGGSVAKGDDRWFDVVRWVGNALVIAEALGVTSDNIDGMRDNGDPNVRRLTGQEGSLGKQLGLSDTWARDAVKQVGNYGEMWQRDIAPTGVERGLNRVWTQGGLMFSPPLR